MLPINLENYKRKKPDIKCRRSVAFFVPLCVFVSADELIHFTV